MLKYILLVIAFLQLQAANLDISYDTLIPAKYTGDIDQTTQLILPVDNGRHITVLLDADDIFEHDSLRNMIKETEKSDDFYILASYRSKDQNRSASYLRHAQGSQFAHWFLQGKIQDPVTETPVINAYFHEFCHINKKVTVRYLGNLKTLTTSQNILHYITSDPLKRGFDSGIATVLAIAHAHRGDFDRTKKYMHFISDNHQPDETLAILQIAHLALQKEQTNVAIQALNKIWDKQPHLAFLLYKIHTDSNPDELRLLSNCILQVLLKKNPWAEIALSHIYIHEVAKKEPDTPMWQDLLNLAILGYRDVAKKHNNTTAMFWLFFALHFISNEEKHLLFGSKEELCSYANQCIAVINKKDSNDYILQIKNDHPCTYNPTLELIKRYGTDQVLE